MSPLKRYNNLKCHWSQFEAKTFVSMNKNVFANIAERFKQKAFLTIGTAHLKECKQLFECKHILLL
jgi:hypothetical protein